MYITVYEVAYRFFRVFNGISYLYLYVKAYLSVNQFRAQLKLSGSSLGQFTLKLSNRKFPRWTHVETCKLTWFVPFLTSTVGNKNKARSSAGLSLIEMTSFRCQNRLIQIRLSNFILQLPMTIGRVGRRINACSLEVKINTAKGSRSWPLE